VGGIPEIAHRGDCDLVPPGDPDRLAHALRRHLQGAAPSRLAAVPPRSHEDAAADLTAFFQELLDRRPRVALPSHRAPAKRRDRALRCTERPRDVA
jgi:hypothetical protein